MFHITINNSALLSQRGQEVWPLDISTDEHDRCVNKQWVQENLSHNPYRLHRTLRDSPLFLDVRGGVVCFYYSHIGYNSVWAQKFVLLSGIQPHCDAFKSRAIFLYFWLDTCRFYWQMKHHAHPAKATAIARGLSQSFVVFNVSFASYIFLAEKGWMSRHWGFKLMLSCVT